MTARWLPMGALVGLALALPAQDAPAQAQQENAPERYPYSIMAPERGARPQRRKQPEQQQQPGQSEQPVKTERPRRRIGSGSPAAPPPPSVFTRPGSVVTAPGTAPRIIETPPVANANQTPHPVPGFTTVTPPPAALGGQSFQDKAAGCIQHGMNSGIGAGQIGAYTQSCVNTR